MESEFVKWLSGELERREVSASQAALKGGISAGQLNHVLSGTRKPGMRTYRAIAKALELNLLFVMEKAGENVREHKPADAGASDQAGWDDVTQELISLVLQISLAARQYLLIWVKTMFVAEHAGMSFSMAIKNLGKML